METGGSPTFSAAFFASQIPEVDHLLSIGEFGPRDNGHSPPFLTSSLDPAFEMEFVVKWLHNHHLVALSNCLVKVVNSTAKME